MPYTLGFACLVSLALTDPSFLLFLFLISTLLDLMGHSHTPIDSSNCVSEIIRHRNPFHPERVQTDLLCMSLLPDRGPCKNHLLSSSVRAGIVTYLDITACGTMCIGCLQVLCLFVGATEASRNFCASVSPATKSSFHIESEGPYQILHSFSESFPSHLSGNCLSSYLLSFFFFYWVFSAVCVVFKVFINTRGFLSATFPGDPVC